MILAFSRWSLKLRFKPGLRDTEYFIQIYCFAEWRFVSLAFLCSGLIFTFFFSRRGAASAQHVTLIVLHPQNTGIFPPEGSPSIDSTIKQRARYHIIPSPFASHSETKVKSKGLPDTATFSTEIISPLECRGLLATTITAGTQKWDGIIRIPERTEGEAEGNEWETRAERIQAVQRREGRFFSAEI